MIFFLIFKIFRAEIKNFTVRSRSRLRDLGRLEPPKKVTAPLCNTGCYSLAAGAGSHALNDRREGDRHRGESVHHWC